MVDPGHDAGKRVILAALELFAGLPDAILDRIAAASRMVDCARGAPIFAKGDDGFGLMAVASGTVKISVTAEDGREVVLAHIGKGEVFGELALLDGLPRTADASALTPCSLFVLDRRCFVPLLVEQPAIAVKLLEIVARRLRRTDEMVESLSFEASEMRLAKALLRLAELQGVSTTRQPRVIITQRELGQIVHLSRESTNKHLREWQVAGLIELGKGICIIRDPVALRRRETPAR